jgi:hypothetical protein
MKKLLLAALCVAVPLILYADVVELTTGEKFEGKIIARDESGVTLKVEFGLIIIENKFVKSIEEDDGGGKKKDENGDKEDEAKEDEADILRLKSRAERWMKSRNKLICEKCGGDGKEKCPYCKGSGQQPADPHARTMRG